MSQIVVGDIHGMLEEAKALIKRIQPSKSDLIVLAGDLVDKGPDSAGVVKFFRGLRDEGYQVVLVLGNHEEKHARFRKAYAKAGEKGVRKFYGAEEILSIQENLSAEDFAFLDSAVPYYRLPDRDAVVIHGGVTEDMASLDDKGALNKLLRTRFVRGKTERKVVIEFDLEGDDATSVEEIIRQALQAKILREQRKEKGSFLGFGQNGPEDPFWADVYDGRFGHVYFGHQPFIGPEPACFPHATGLDTGAVFGGYLTAAILDDGKDPEFVSIKASRKYAEVVVE